MSNSLRYRHIAMTIWDSVMATDPLGFAGCSHVPINVRDCVIEILSLACYTAGGVSCKR